MHFQLKEAKIQFSNDFYSAVSGKDGIKVSQPVRKSIGFGHIRMRSNVRPPEKLKESEKNEKREQTDMRIARDERRQKQWCIFLEQMNSRAKIQNRNTTKPLKRPVSSFENICSTRRQNSAMYPANTKLKSFTSLDLDLAKLDMQSICSKMTNSIILSSETAESIPQKKWQLSDQSFTRIKFLGQGKFGQVYLVRHKQTGFICALKIIDKKVVRQEKVQSQLAKQLRIHSQLHSLNIISFYGCFSDENNFYITMQYATQGSLFSQLRGKSRLQEQEIQPIAKGICDGLRFIHGMGFVHRDIKPENIVLQFGVPKICDFGWANNCGQFDLCKSYCGTPLYLSPQMIKKQFYGTSVDIWALGLVIYELLVGRIPFRVWNQQDIGQILTKQIQFPEYIDRSQNCESFIRRCLQKQTYQRMQMEQAVKHPFIRETDYSTKFPYSLVEWMNNILFGSG